MTRFGSDTRHKNSFHFLVCLAAVAVCGWLSAGQALAQEKDAGNGTVYHTPLAGEARDINFLGHVVPIPGMDRGRLTALTLGGSLLDPRQGSTGGVPVVSLFLRRVTDEYRTRDAISLVVNELEYDRRYDNFELVTHFENFTLPGDITELRKNREIKQTAVTWGSLLGSVGPGVRFTVPPGDVDNELRFHLLGRVGYMYAEKSHETGSDVVIPSSTMLYGARLRGRYDGLTRNLLELPHKGIAAGFDVDYLHRDHWHQLTPSGTGTVGRNVVQAKGYLVGAGGIPGLSERDRLLVSLNAGKTNERSADRFDAFQLNGGPFPAETDDLVRPHFTGILYDDVRVTNYAIAAAGYRRELTFFLYLSLIGSYIWADRVHVEGVDQVGFKETTGVAGTVSLDSAFFLNSELYLAYTWDSGFLRDGRPGSGVLVMWSKSM